MPAGKGLLGGAEHEPAVHGDLTRSKAQAVQLGGGLVQQAVLARVAGRAGRGQDIPAGAASNVGGDLGDLGDVAELAWLAKLALTDRARVGIAQRHQPVADLLLPQPLLDLGADPLAALSERLQPPGGAQLGLGAAPRAAPRAWAANLRASPIELASARPAAALSATTASTRWPVRLASVLEIARTSLPTVDSSGTRSAQGDQAEPPQVQGVGYLPQQRLVPPAGALLDNHQPHEAGHRDRRPTVPARRRLPHPFDRRQQQPIGQ